jgi:Chagasin family peptidase inhibitor I42
VKSKRDSYRDLIFIEKQGSSGFTVRALKNGIGGYIWTVDFNQRNFQVETRTLLEASESIGGGSTAVFNVTCKEGRASTLTFRLARPWEQRALYRVSILASPKATEILK